MSRRNDRVRQAVKAKSNELSAVLEKDTLLPSYRVLHASELDENERASIWSLFEENMHDLYLTSSFGWMPAEKKKELFDKLSRFLLVNDAEDTTKMAAFCMFRFEKEEGENVVYCYDIQISSQCRRCGMGKKLMEVLSTIGKAFRMEKLVLTVLKANTGAMAFYRACGFQVDPNSPSEYLPEGDTSIDDYDYEILSKKFESA